MAENISKVINESTPTDNITQPENIVNSNGMQNNEADFYNTMKEEGLNVGDESGIINQNNDPVYEVYQGNKPISNTDPVEYQHKIDNAKVTYNLTSEESASIEQYVGGMAFELNGVLLGNTDYESTPFTDYWIENTINGLKKMPNYEGRTYRNLTFESQEDFQAFLDRHQPGARVVLKNFSSTSKDPNGYVISGKYIVHMVFDGVSGKDISGSFSIPEQQEVIYLPNTEIEITDVKTANDGYPLIYVREARTNGKNMETNNRKYEQSPTGADNEGQRGNVTGEGNDLGAVYEHRGISGNGGEVGKSQVFESAEVGKSNNEDKGTVLSS